MIARNAQRACNVNNSILILLKEAYHGNTMREHGDV
jgi:hypothetical protein